VTVMIQTKSVTPENMALIASLPDRSGILLVTDDIEPPLLQDGHLSRIVTLAIDAGLPPLEAYASASLRAARYLNLRDQGAIAPGYRADFMLMDDPATFPASEVFVDGQCVATAGKMLDHKTPELPPLPPSPPVPVVTQTDMLRLDRSDHPASDVVANVVVLENKRNTLTILEQHRITLKDGYAVFEDGDALNLVAVIARNGSGSTVGIVKNTGIERGAFATSLAHDSHNLLIIGRDVSSMLTASQAVQRQGGGVAVAREADVLAALPLPLFGLLSDAPAPTVAHDLEAVEETLRQLGVDHLRPFLTLSIMALSVSPYYKFSDKGIVDTERRALLPAWETAAPHE
jgi:adenine deaminase